MKTLMTVLFLLGARAWGQQAEFESIVAEAQGSEAAQASRRRSSAAAALAAGDERIVPGVTLEFYQKVLVMSHTALRIEDQDGSFWQLELQGKSEYTSIKDPKYTKLGIKVKFGPVPASVGDVIIYNDAQERRGVEKLSRHQGSAKICRSGAGARKPLSWYRGCLEEKAKAYTVDAFRYDPVIRNCSHFAEIILAACELANCQDYPYSTGTLHHKGVLGK